MPADCPPVLTILARQPRPGSTKTRLVPALGGEGAARLASAMLGWTVEVARLHWPGPVRIATWPPAPPASFARGLGVPVVDQCGDELGERMLYALKESGIPGAVMGSDVPHVDGVELARAAEMLVAGEDVVGPAYDGGFYFLGLQAVVPGLFDGIAWGGTDVYTRMQGNARRFGITFSELAPVRDIDTPADLARVAAHFPRLESFLSKHAGRVHG